MTVHAAITDEIDEVRAYARWLIGDTPSRAWQAAFFAAWTGSRRPLRWMARHLRIPADDPRAWFALAGFAPMEISGLWHIAAPVPAPDPFTPGDFPSDTVVVIDPEANTAAVLGSPGPELIVPEPQPDSLFVHTDPMRWLRDWADERVIFFETRRDAIARSRIVPTFSGEPLAALAIGDLADLPWSRLTARVVRADFATHKAIKRAIFRSAHLPTVEAA